MPGIGTEPIFYVLVQPAGKGEAARIDATDLITSFEFEDSEKKTDLLKLEVDNFDLSNFDDPIWKPGNKVIATWGYPGKMSPARECIITKVKGAIKLSIQAQGKAVLMNTVTRSKTYENTRRSEIVYAIAKENGFEGANVDIEETEEVYEHIVQARQTDAQFLKMLADKEHFEFYVDFSGLHWHSRRMGQRPLRKLQYYLPPEVGDILTFDVENDIFAKPAAVATKGRDPLKKKDVGGEGSNSKTERSALAPVVEIKEPINEQTGLTHYEVKETKPTTETSAAQAKKEADGAFKRSVQTTVKLTLELVGDPFIIAKSVLDIQGISKRLSGLYYVNQANHKIDSSGYKLSIKCASDGTRGHSEDLLRAYAGPGTASTATKASLAACQAEAKAKTEELNRAGAADKARLQGELNAINQRCKAIEAAIGKGAVNPGGAPKDPNASTIKENIDGSTGITTFSYHPDGPEKK